MNSAVRAVCRTQTALNAFVLLNKSLVRYRNRFLGAIGFARPRHTRLTHRRYFIHLGAARIACGFNNRQPGSGRLGTRQSFRCKIFQIPIRIGFLRQKAHRSQNLPLERRLFSLWIATEIFAPRQFFQYFVNIAQSVFYKGFRHPLHNFGTNIRHIIFCRQHKSPLLIYSST